MSAIARYFLRMGINVWGYDKTATALTSKLMDEGVKGIYFEDNTFHIPSIFKQGDQSGNLIIYTPAIPESNEIFQFFKTGNFELQKRSAVLGLITANSINYSVAGTHGKTTTSCLLSHILHIANVPFSAFLGGISSNYQSNYIETGEAKSNSISITEADEFDRSFLQLRPTVAGITSMDADHLDIYGESESLKESFVEFAELVAEDGALFIQHQFADGLLNKMSHAASYGIDQGQIQGQDVRVENGTFVFDYVNTVDNIDIPSLSMGLPGIHNVENAVLAISMALKAGADTASISNALSSFTGVKRRFETVVKTNNAVYIDDYAHHPTELRSTIESIRTLYPGKKITAVFQPHLFSRTRDFMDGFAEELSKVDELILMEIYPAREKPIAGITSSALLEKINCKKTLSQKSDLLNTLKNKELEVLVTLGAGDIDQFVEPIKTELPW